MDHSKVSIRYAKAFFSLAKEKNLLIPLRKDVELVFQLCQKSTDFRLLLESPVVKTSQKIKLAKAIFSQQLNPLTMKFLELVFSNNRESELAGICRNFLLFYRQNLGVKTATITTAVEMDTTILEQIQAKLEKELKAQVELNKQVDPKLIGGFVLRIDDQQVDASVSAQLRKVKEKLLQSDIK
ncbi:MAG: ATP synthase F1 subunit delta [Mangrovibacterium sp.]